MAGTPHNYAMPAAADSITQRCAINATLVPAGNIQPFGDTDGPLRHSTSYYPASVIGGVAVERGPCGASNVGQATYGGSVNLFSKVLSRPRSTNTPGKRPAATCCR